MPRCDPPLPPTGHPIRGGPLGSRDHLGAPSRKSVNVERLFIGHQIFHLGLFVGRIPSQTVLHMLLDFFLIVVSPTQENTQGTHGELCLQNGKIVRHGGGHL